MSRHQTVNGSRNNPVVVTPAGLGIKVPWQPYNHGFFTERRTVSIFITPEIAEEVLRTRAGNNRKLRKDHVKRLAADMACGAFRQTHQGIAFRANGLLCDGFHRLNAIADSGVGVWVTVTFGMTDEDALVIDTGRPRTVADEDLFSTGHPPATGVYQTSRAMDNGFAGKQKIRSHREDREFANLHREAITFALERLPFGKRGIGRAAVVAVVARAYYTVDHFRLSRFCEVLRTSMANPGTSEESVINLRDFLKESAGGGGEMFQVSYRKTERALWAFLNGERLQLLREASAELFPIPGDE